MEFREIIATVEGKLITEVAQLDMNVTQICAADLMSDVLAFAEPECILLTGLCNPQVVCTAEMADISAVIFVRNKQPPPETISLAEEEHIPLISTPHSMFEACGRLYQAGLKGISISDHLV